MNNGRPIAVLVQPETESLAINTECDWLCRVGELPMGYGERSIILACT